MINIDYLTLRAFLRESENYFLGARIQKIRQTSPRDLVLCFRNKGESRKLYINITPDIYHVSFMSEESEDRRNLVYPSKPPMFCMLLRKYLDNAKVVAVSQPPNERILELELETKNEIDGEKTLILAIELMGKYSNIVLYDKLTSVIIGCAHNVGENKSQVRELYGGIPYVYPPKSSKKDFFRFFGQVNYETLQDDYLGFSRYFASLCVGLDAEQIKDLLELKKVNPAMNELEYSIFGDLLPNGKVYCTSVNQMLDDYYSKIQLTKKLESVKAELKNISNSRYQKVKSSLNKIATLRTKRDNTDKYKLYGELLTAYAYMNENFVKEVTLDDYNTGEPVTIPVDETLTMIDNAKWYYKLYSKSKRTKEKTEELLSSLTESKVYWEEVLYSIENADSFQILQEIKDEITPTKNQQQNSKPVLQPIYISNFTVYIGRNNKQNDYIISKLAKDEDIWFHTKDRAGSHVLLKLQDNREPDEQVIFECCKLAKQFSSVPENEKAGVIYTKRKYLRKPPAANLGYVTYRNEKEMYI